MDFEWYRDQLLAQERELRQKLGREVEDAIDTQDDQFQGSDEASVEDQRDDALRLAQTDTDILEFIGDALQRIDDGTYGRCVVDGVPIDEKRLRAIPWTPYCAKHQQQAEEAAGLRTPRM